ncbi:MAG TPA: hypothetical protein VHN20_05820 [Beijerinckiaceae bacterium]|nr:hypothetical protein [Beijerinckiaceae bacterium]
MLADTASSLRSLGDQTKENMRAVWEGAKKLPRPAQVIPASGRCDVSAGGQLNCREAAVRACKAKGYASGRAVDTASVEACRPARPHERQSGEMVTCQTRYEVTTALCW